MKPKDDAFNRMAPGSPQNRIMPEIMLSDNIDLIEVRGSAGRRRGAGKAVLPRLATAPQTQYQYVITRSTQHDLGQLKIVSANNHNLSS
ncbi:hypothetical protein J6590_102792, partial [Homalodisca vitripennis]